MTFQTHPRTRPTFYFVGVTTGQSSSMRVFPRWMEVLGSIHPIAQDVVIEGVDMALHDEPENYRRLVAHIKADPLSLGGLVTTHKIDLLDASRDLFEHLGPDANFLGEVSSISKVNGALHGHATDPSAGGKSLASIIPKGYFGQTGAHVLCFGAGGSAAALALHLINQYNSADRPNKMIVVNRSQPRLDRLQQKVEALTTTIDFAYILNEDPAQNDALMASLPSGSLVVNATGMGKDRPGSPITDAGLFPQNGVVWEYNYRGALGFLHQAITQQEKRSLIVEDGWIYFLHGWTQVISHVLHVDIDSELFEKLGRIALKVR